jgi:hypothetical protein
MRLLVKRVTIHGKDDIRCTYRLPLSLDGQPVRATNEGVEPAGLEPATFWLPARRSPS